jgi:hypothetical protein
MVEIGEVVTRDSRPLSGRYRHPNRRQLSLQRAGSETQGNPRVRTVLPSRHLCGALRRGLFGVANDSPLASIRRNERAEEEARDFLPSPLRFRVIDYAAL